MLMIFAALLAAALSVYVYRRTAPVPVGRAAEISVNGQMVDTLYLDEIKEPLRLVYETKDGYNTVYADSEGLSVVESDCHDRYCVKAGRISRPGSSLVCLPHRFVVRISGGETDGIDGGTY